MKASSLRITAGRPEFHGDASGRVTRMQQDESLPRGFRGSGNCPREPARGRQEHDEDEPEQLAHNEFSLDDEKTGSVGFAA